MHARLAGRREVDDHVALAVEAARVAHVGVVVGGDVDVVVLGPADALEANRHRRAGRPRRRRDADDAGFDDEVRRAASGSSSSRSASPVQPADIVRNRHRRRRASVASHRDLADDVVLAGRTRHRSRGLPTEVCPHDAQPRAGGEAVASQPACVPDRALRRRDRQRRAWRPDFRLRESAAPDTARRTPRRSTAPPRVVRNVNCGRGRCATGDCS